MLHSILENAASTWPDRPGILWHGSPLTFADLAKRSRATRDLVLNTTRAGEQVAIVGDNHRAWIDAYYGVPRASRVLTFLNHRLSPSEIGDAIHRSGSVLLIAGDAQLGRLSTVIDDLPSVRQVIPFSEWDDSIGRVAGGADADRDATSPDAAAWLIFTSGTTAKPKGAVLTSSSLTAALRATASGRPVREDDIYVFPFPLCHVAGYNVLHHHVHGRPVVLMDRYDPSSFVETASAHRATCASLAATMLADLLDQLHDHPADVDRLSELRHLAYGAAPMPAALLRRAHNVLGVTFSQGFGMTELSGNAVFLGPTDHERGLAGDERLLRAAGRPAAEVELRIIDDAGEVVEAGRQGEILIRAPQLFAGYWQDPASTGEAFVDDWFRTGDVGFFVGDLLTVVDRKKDVIISGGENVSSLEVEEAVRNCPAVADVAVVAGPDERWGEVIIAFVVPRAGLSVDEGEVQATVRAVLAGFKVPKRVIELEALPKNGAGKVLKAALRRQLREQDPQASKSDDVERAW